MPGIAPQWRRRTARLLVGALAPAAFVFPRAVSADEAIVVAPRAVVAPASSPALSLASCRQIALEKQPALAAARASLAAAVARSEAVEHLRFAALLSRDIPIRRKQAALGVQIAQAALAQAEADTLHGVAYSYLAALYARQQQAVADEGIANLTALRDRLKEYLDAGEKNIRRSDVDRASVYLAVGRSRREEAVQGYERALSALREAMGVCSDFPVVPADAGMPAPKTSVEREHVVASALARRGEIAQAATAAEVTSLEIDAQQTTHRPKADTFAAGSDIHAAPLPAGVHDDIYKPGALGLEMPRLLAGSKGDRVEQARAYSARAEAVVAKTRGLIALEAEQAYLRWLEANRKVVPAREAATAADALFKELKKNFDPQKDKPTPDQLINAGVMASQLRIQANQAAYQELLALAALERVTAGGFCAGFEGADRSVK